jgi:hypothetical protein
MASGNSWESNDSWQEYGSSSSSENAANDLPFPVFPTIPAGNIDMGAINSVLGVGGRDDDVADYLEYDRSGRPFLEQLQGSCGAAYFTGIFGGGAFGAVQGFQRSPSTKFKIRMNSLMNGAAIRGSKAGNALGCLGKYNPCLI